MPIFEIDFLPNNIPPYFWILYVTLFDPIVSPLVPTNFLAQEMLFRTECPAALFNLGLLIYLSAPRQTLPAFFYPREIAAPFATSLFDHSCQLVSPIWSIWPLCPNALVTPKVIPGVIPGITLL